MFHRVWIVVGVLVSKPRFLTRLFVISFQGHACDVFESYPQLLTEMVLRLPYQVRPTGRGLDRGGAWKGAGLG